MSAGGCQWDNLVKACVQGDAKMNDESRTETRAETATSGEVSSPRWGPQTHNHLVAIFIEWKHEVRAVLGCRGPAHIHGPAFPAQSGNAGSPAQSSAVDVGGSGRVGLPLCADPLAGYIQAAEELHRRLRWEARQRLGSCSETDGRCCEYLLRFLISIIMRIMHSCGYHQSQQIVTTKDG